MNIQIFGKAKCFDTKKAQRFFKERKINFQYVDILDKGLSKGEFNKVAQTVGGYENMINKDSKDYYMIEHYGSEQKQEKLMDTPKLYKTPIVRNGSQATVGYTPDVWKTWE